VLLTVPRTLFLAGSSTTLLAAGRDVAVVEVVVLGTVSPGLPAPCCLATLVWAGEVAGGVSEGGAVQAGVGVGLLLGSPLLAQVGTGRTAVLVIFESLPAFIETNPLSCA